MLAVFTREELEVSSFALERNPEMSGAGGCIVRVDDASNGNGHFGDWSSARLRRLSGGALSGQNDQGRRVTASRAFFYICMSYTRQSMKIWLDGSC